MKLPICTPASLPSASLDSAGDNFIVLTITSDKTSFMTRLLTSPHLQPQASLLFCSFVSCTNPLSALGTLDAMICLPVSLPKSLEDSKSIFFILECIGTGIGLVFIHGHLHAT